MDSKAIQNQIETWAHNKGFDAPYGVLTATHLNKKGQRYLSVTFGRRGTLDATVNIYNRDFITVKTTRYRLQVFKDLEVVENLMDFLNTL